MPPLKTAGSAAVGQGFSREQLSGRAGSFQGWWWWAQEREAGCWALHWPYTRVQKKSRLRARDKASRATKHHGKAPEDIRLSRVLPEASEGPQ